jgi:hypothetical protein
LYSPHLVLALPEQDLEGEVLSEHRRAAVSPLVVHRDRHVVPKAVYLLRRFHLGLLVVAVQVELENKL